MKKLLHALFHTIFWVWNIGFSVTVCAGLWPAIAPEAAKEIFRDPLAQEAFLTMVSLVVVSIICTVIGVSRFRTQPVKLMSLFFGFEVPMLVMCALRLLVLQRLNPASTFLACTALVAVVGFYLELIYGYAKQHRAIATVQAIVHSFLIGVSIYAGALLLFYTVPMIPIWVIGFFSFAWVQPLLGMWSLENWWQVAGSLLMGFTTFLFMLWPWELGSLYIRSGRRVLQAFAEQYGQPRTFQVAIAGLTAWTVLFVALQQQPQLQAFKLLEQPIQTERDRQTLLAKSDAIRAGLLNAYLAEYRYLGFSENNNYFFWGSGQTTDFWQTFHNRLIWPFLYQGGSDDREKAEQLYAQFFDTPIEKGEAATIQPTVKVASVPWWRSLEADLRTIDQRNVWLRSQEVKVAEQGDWAEVELYEVYRNETPQQQEIRYAFTLPETAVLTGVWLGDTANRDYRFTFQVSPRGAAEKVYTEEVRRRVDPALLEQVGPQQYRLRAFPIPPKPAPGESASAQRPIEMHLWLTYKVMRQPQGWALPQLTEKRNIFWNRSTGRRYNGQPDKFAQDRWLPDFLPATSQQTPASHEIDLGSGYRVFAKPVTLKDAKSLQNKRFAVIVDSSYSMSAHRKELEQAMQWLQQQGFADNSLANNDADLYLPATGNATPQRIDDIRQFNLAKTTFFGTIQPMEMLRQFAQLQGDTRYDGILLLTDGGNYELGKNQSKAIANLSAPVWMVHLGGLPIAYNDPLITAMQTTGGGATTDIPSALQRQATQAVLGPSVTTVADGYAWFVEPPTPPASTAKAPDQTTEKAPKPSDRFTAATENEFAPFAARQLILALDREMKTKDLAHLETVHAIAKTFKIVSPYSSMIVLVNEEQREALKKAELSSDRFDRVGDNTSPDDVASAPEPGAIIGVVAIAFFLFKRRPRSRFAMK